MHNIIFIFSGSRVYFVVFGRKIKKNSLGELHNYRQDFLGGVRFLLLQRVHATHPHTHTPRVANKQILMYFGIAESLIIL